MKQTLAKLGEKFMLCFVDAGYWKWLVEGFRNSLIITFFAILLGFAFGILLATVRSSYDKNEETLKLRGGLGYWLLRLVNAVCKIYILSLIHI